MKKLFKIVLASIFTAALFSCSNIGEEDSSKKTNANLKILLSKGGSGSERATITSCSSIPVSDITDWKFSFIEVSEIDDVLVKGNEVEYENVTEEGSAFYEFILPAGYYFATAEGTFVTDSDGKTHTVYGEELIYITDEMTEATIPVGLKKSEGGKGTISIKNIEISDSLLKSITYQVPYNFTIKLTSVETKEEDGVDVPVNTYSFEGVWQQFENHYASLKDEDQNSEISSGYYYLELFLNDYASPLTLKDSLVEIADGEEVIAENIKVVDSSVVRTYYASKNGTGSGLTSSDKINLDDLLNLLNSDDEWANVTVYSTTNPVFDISEDSDFMKINRNVNFVVPSFADFSVCNGVVTVGSSGTTSTLRFTGNGEITIKEPSEISSIELKDGAKVKFDEVYLNYSKDVSLIVDDDYYSNFADAETPFAKVEYRTDTKGYLNFRERKESVSSPSYELTSNEDHTSFYFVKLGTADVTLGQVIPNFKIQAATGDGNTESGRSILFEDANVSFKCVDAAGEEIEFAEGATIEWTINNQKFEPAVSINPTTTDLYLNATGENIVKCVVQVGDIVKSELFTFKLKMPLYTGNVLWDKGTSTTYFAVYDDSSVSSANPTENNLFADATDFAFDGKGNLYVINADETTGTSDATLTRYMLQGDGSYTTGGVIYTIKEGAAYKLYGDTEKNIIYVAYKPSGENRLNLLQIKNPDSFKSSDSPIVFADDSTTGRFSDTYYDFAVYDDYLYTYENSNIYYNHFGDGQINYYYDDKYEIGEKYWIPKGPSLYNNGLDYSEKTIKVTDMCVVDGILYLTFSKITDLTADILKTDTDDISSCGGLARVKINDDYSLSAMDGEYSGYGSVLGWPALEDPITVTGTNVELEPLEKSIYQPEAVNSTSLFGAQKFIAVNSKKLVIADDGYFFHDSSDDDKRGKIKPVSRVVTFDLANGEFEVLGNTSATLNYDKDDTVSTEFFKFEE